MPCALAQLESGKKWLMLSPKAVKKCTALAEK